MRRSILLLGLLTTAASVCPPRRPPLSERTFSSQAVDALIEAVSSQLADPDLACLFSNCFPNTLDTTVQSPEDGFVVTGDIPAMWIRDSTNQLLPYMELASSDEGLARLLAAAVQTQASQVLADPYANAHVRLCEGVLSDHSDDSTSKVCFGPSRCNAMVGGIWERKYELDSLCAFLKLSRSYHSATHDTAPFDDHWLAAVRLVIATMRQFQSSSAEEASSEGGAPYLFQRAALEPTDTLLHGTGAPARRTGLVRSSFRPSDDATTFPFLIPANAMAVVELRAVSALLRALPNVATAEAVAAEADALAGEVDDAIHEYGTTSRSGFGEIYAYEVDGYGNALFMPVARLLLCGLAKSARDDANVPSLLSLPYLGFTNASDEMYQRTREAVLSETVNPWFFIGKAGEGVGGPHVGRDMIWPMGIIIRALTSNDDAEIATCLETLVSAAARTGLMHESFNKDNAASYTRPWFAWANALFGELVIKLAKTKPHLVLRPDAEGLLIFKSL